MRRTERPETKTIFILLKIHKALKKVVIDIQPSPYSSQPIIIPAHTRPSPYSSQPILIPAHTRQSPYSSKPIIIPAHTRPSPYLSQLILARAAFDQICFSVVHLSFRSWLHP